jgi:predicted XRE-type DNA-binding protein
LEKLESDRAHWQADLMAIDRALAMHVIQVDVECIDLTKSSGNIFVDLGFDKDESAVMLVRMEVAARIVCRIKEKGWTAAEVTLHLGLTENQASQLIQTKIDGFSLEMLWALAVRLDLPLKLAAP